MPLPSVNGFGIKDNPLIDTPFVQNMNTPSVFPPPSGGDFLLLQAPPNFFLLLNGGNLLLL
jgi:hypothetical protein